VEKIYLALEFTKKLSRKKDGTSIVKKATEGSHFISFFLKKIYLKTNWL
jgi:hypothetical protein